MEQRLRIRELINRLARMDATQGWDGDLNPTQHAVLGYLLQANRFSRSPSHVADYLGTTRGTVSQSLKSLSQKGYVAEKKSEKDKRAISYQLTEKGRSAAELPNALELAVESLAEPVQDQLLSALDALFTQLVTVNNGRSFGVCKSCIHFAEHPTGGYCSLLSEVLSPEDASQICHEQDGR